jgi:N-acetylmuramoyl-L-alanine amidase
MSKKLQLLIIHCTATPEGRPITSATIRRWHTAPKPQGNGWKQVGYSEMIHLNGTIETLVNYNDNDIVDAWEITNGAAGVNSIARHIVYVGGTDVNGKAKDTRTVDQLKALEMYVKAHTTLQPQWKIAGHYHFAAKACPSFNVEKWLESIGIPEKNIYRKK